MLMRWSEALQAKAGGGQALQYGFRSKIQGKTHLSRSESYHYRSRIIGISSLSVCLKPQLYRCTSNPVSVYDTLLWLNVCPRVASFCTSLSLSLFACGNLRDAST